MPIQVTPDRTALVPRPRRSCAPQNATGDLRGQSAKAFQLLQRMVAKEQSLLSQESGQQRHVSITEEAWRDVFFETLNPNMSARNKQQAFRRAREGLIENGSIVVSHGSVSIKSGA